MIIITGSIMNTFEFIVSILPRLLEGLIVTFQLTALCLVIGSLLGFSSAIAKIYGNKPLQYLVTVYTEFFRGTPLIAQLLLSYYGLPGIGITLDRFTVAYLVIGINNGAYQCEIFRGAIQAISSGQVEAGHSLGMSKIQVIGHIIVPQALRLAIPAWSNEVIYMLKTTPLVFIIGVLDLFNEALIIVARTFRAVETYLIVALIYILIVFGISKILALIESRYRIPTAPVT